MKTSKIIAICIPLYFGFSLSAFAKLGLTNWQFYAILLPVTILTAFKEFYLLKENDN